MRILAGAGRKDLSLHCGPRAGLMRRTALMCRNAACQNDSSANLLKNNFLCATLKLIRQLNDKVTMLHAWRPENLEVVLP